MYEVDLPPTFWRFPEWGPAWKWLQNLRNFEIDGCTVEPFTMSDDIQTIYFVREDDAVAFKLANKL